MGRGNYQLVSLRIANYKAASIANSDNGGFNPGGDLHSIVPSKSASQSANSLGELVRLTAARTAWLTTARKSRPLLPVVSKANRRIMWILSPLNLIGARNSSSSATLALASGNGISILSLNKDQARLFGPRFFKHRRQPVGRP